MKKTRVQRKQEREEDVQDYRFPGVEVPPNLWLSSRIKSNELKLLMQVAALDNPPKHCTVSNRWLADTLDIEVRRVQQMLSRLIGLKLVDREVNGPYRTLRIDIDLWRSFDREATMQKIACRGRDGKGLPERKNDAATVQNIAYKDGAKWDPSTLKKCESSMQFIAWLPCNKMHAYHALYCTQVVEVENVEGKRSTTLNVEEAASRTGSDISLVCADGACNTLDADGQQGEGLLIAGAKTEVPDSGQGTGRTDRKAPWFGKSYSNTNRGDLYRIEDYGDIDALCDEDPIFAAMCVTGDTMSGGYGYWVKWADSWMEHCEHLEIPDPLESVKQIFVDCLSVTWAERDGVKSLASIFNTKLKKTWETPK